MAPTEVGRAPTTVAALRRGSSPIASIKAAKHLMQQPFIDQLVMMASLSLETVKIPLRNLVRSQRLGSRRLIERDLTEVGRVSTTFTKDSRSPYAHAQH